MSRDSEFGFSHCVELLIFLFFLKIASAREASQQKVCVLSKYNYFKLVMLECDALEHQHRRTLEKLGKKQAAGL